MNRKNIISLEQITDYETYRPILLFSEDLDFDNKFCVLNTDVGNIGFSYYDLGVAPSYIIHDTILFLSCGSSYYIVNLKEKKVIYESRNSLSVIFEIVKPNKQSCVVFIGELSLICFSLSGQKMWENDYRHIVCDWSIMNEGVKIIFENNEKLLVLFSNGNGIPVL